MRTIPQKNNLINYYYFGMIMDKNNFGLLLLIEIIIMIDLNKNVETVKVMVRCRPMSTRERQDGRIPVVEIDEKIGQVVVRKANDPSDAKSFTFDYAFGTESTQQSVYQQTGFQLVQNVLEGYNATIFAYGQTGCGKTFIMMGVQEDQMLRGIIPRTFHQIITMVDTDDSKKFLIRCSFLEIYNQEIHDLLSEHKSNLELKQSPDKGVFIKDLSLNVVKTVRDMEKWMTIGFKNRAVRATQMNAQSSRSHSIFTVHIESSQQNSDGGCLIKAGKLNLVDLAGSERQSKTHAVGEGLKQAAKINLSLSALGNVISALVDGKSQHIPYRDSKLTRLLQDSLGGNTKTIMIAALSPVDYNYQETISTLRYASRAKFIKNKPKINQDPKDAALREYAEEIQRLKMMLDGRIPMNSAGLKSSASSTSLQNGFGNNQIKDQLIMHEKMIQSEKQEREKLRLQLQNLQEIMSKPKPKKEEKEQKQKMLKLKQQLKEQKKKREDFKRQRQRHDQIVIGKQKNFNNLQQQIDSMRKQFKQLNVKYKQVQRDIDDVNEQQALQKQDLLETIRQQQRDLNKLTSIMQMLLTQQQIQRLQKRCVKDQQTDEYLIPAFVLKQKQYCLPKLRQSQQYFPRKQSQTSAESSRFIESPHHRSYSTSKNVNVQLNPIPLHLKKETKDISSMFTLDCGGRQSEKRRPSKLDPLIPTGKQRKS